MTWKTLEEGENKGSFIKDGEQDGDKVRIVDPATGKTLVAVSHEWTRVCPGRAGRPCVSPHKKWTIELRRTAEGTVRDQPCCKDCRK